MLCLRDTIRKSCPDLQELIENIEKQQTLAFIVLATLQLVFTLAVKIVEEMLKERAEREVDNPYCSFCGTKLQSKGFVKRQMLTLVGIVKWKRRVVRCAYGYGCRTGQIAPFDEELDIYPYQRVSAELSQIMCMLAVFVPYETVKKILTKMFPINISTTSIYNCVQWYGDWAIISLRFDLYDLIREGIEPKVEVMNKATAQLPLVIGANGVQVPFRPQRGSPKGKADWKEVKVGVLARMGKRITNEGEIVPKLEQRRLVAFAGHIDEFGVRLWLEAKRQGIEDAKKVAWLSDGGKGFWALFFSYFASLAVGILDFYHAAQNLWKAASAALDGRTTEAMQWFKLVRHQLRHGEKEEVFTAIEEILFSKKISDKAQKILLNLYGYLEQHYSHIDYPVFKESGLPIGSGIVESACKWLVQQRFKGSGMRWSQKGFDNLLQLRLAWVNERFDEVFYIMSPNK